ncbi:hypothetical protein DICPUDRAFT_28096, partial [Dictyostelium purpureum]
LVLNVGYNTQISQCEIPESVTHLELGFLCVDESPLQKLPSNLKFFKPSPSFNHQIIEGYLPQSLEVLKFPKMSSFNQELLPNTLPHNLKTLKFGMSYTKQIQVGVLPKALQILK